MWRESCIDILINITFAQKSRKLWLEISILNFNIPINGRIMNFSSKLTTKNIFRVSKNPHWSFQRKAQSKSKPNEIAVNFWKLKYEVKWNPNYSIWWKLVINISVSWRYQIIWIKCSDKILITLVFKWFKMSFSSDAIVTHCIRYSGLNISPFVSLFLCTYFT